MNELFKSSVSSMNYLFLKETFYADIRMNEYVLGELEIFLTNLVSNWTPEIEEIIQTEIVEGGYLEGLELEEIHLYFKESVAHIFGCECADSLAVMDKYINLSIRVLNNCLND